MLNLWDTLEGRKEEKKEARGKGHSVKGELKKGNSLKQSQDKLACIYCDLMWRVWKEEKKEKDEEKNREAIRPVKMGVTMWSPREKRSPNKWDWGLAQSWRTAWLRASKREEKNREREKIHGEKDSNEWKEKESFSLLKLYL